MINTIKEIRAGIEGKGGLKNFPSSIRKNKNSARPSRFNLKTELQELTNEELNVAFFLGLIGNNNKEGSIVSNATFFHK